MISKKNHHKNKGVKMDILKFLRSFNVVDTYLILTFIVFAGLTVYFYVIDPL